MINLKQQYIYSAKLALKGELENVNIVREGNLILFNASTKATYDGYSTDLEYLKGLICRQLPDNRLEIVSPCLRKFYNLGEKPEGDKFFFNALKKPTNKVYLLEKIDGSCLRCFYASDTNEIKFPTRGMINGAPSEEDDKYINFGKESLRIAQEKYPKILDPEVLKKCVPVFELIHPQNKMVIDYNGVEDLILLTVFHNTYQDTRELNYEEMCYFARQYGLKVVKKFNITSNAWDDIMVQITDIFNTLNVEGVVAVLEEDGEITKRIKIKSPKYLRMLKLVTYCTLANTYEVKSYYNLKTWIDFKSYILKEFVDLPEEVMMVYEKHFAICVEYDKYIEGKIIELIDEYYKVYKELGISIISKETKKQFALAVANHKDKAFLFILWGCDINADEKIEQVEGYLKKQLTIKDFGRNVGVVEEDING